MGWLKKIVKKITNVFNPKKESAQVIDNTAAIAAQTAANTAAATAYQKQQDDLKAANAIREQNLLNAANEGTSLSSNKAIDNTVKVEVGGGAASAADAVDDTPIGMAKKRKSVSTSLGLT